MPESDLLSSLIAFYRSAGIVTVRCGVLHFLSLSAEKRLLQLLSRRRGQRLDPTQLQQWSFSGWLPPYSVRGNGIVILPCRSQSKVEAHPECEGMNQPMTEMLNLSLAIRN